MSERDAVQHHVVERNLTFPAEPTVVWAHVRDFGALTRMELTGDPLTPGTERVARSNGRVLIRERLDAIDDERRTLEYSLVQFPFPITRHHAALTVKPTGNGQVTVTWRAEFDADAETADAMERFIGGGFESGLMELAGKTNAARLAS